MKKFKTIILIAMGVMVLSFSICVIGNVITDISKREACDRMTLTQVLEHKYCINYFTKKYR